jgi:hypothetical protein
VKGAGYHPLGVRTDMEEGRYIEIEVKEEEEGSKSR